MSARGGIMIYKVVIGGCREFKDYGVLCEFADTCLTRLAAQGDICIVSGGCRGVDEMGERYAAERGYAVERHPADWKRYGRSAGPRRNREMVELADYVIAFWDGRSRGTRSLIESAKELKKPLRVKMIRLTAGHLL